MSEHSVKDQIFINNLRGIILANLANENFGVPELVHEAAISHYSLNRRLHAITNKTIKQFIREVRLQRALEMLQNEEVNISEVAYKVGFNSAAYFNTCFHEFFGFPPGTVKKGDYINKIDGTDPANVMQRQKKKNTMRLIYLLLSGILVIAVLVYLINKAFFNNSSSDTGIKLNYPEKSIAVLPFKNLSDTLANQYFIDGLMEEILTDLGRIHDLSVISRTSVERYRNNTTKSTPEIARELRVKYIVEGSGQKYANFYRIRVQLIEAKSDKYLWANSYEREITGTKDIYSVQSEIAQAIASELKATVTSEEKEVIEKIPTLNMLALNLFMRARDYQNKYEKTRDLSLYNTAVNLYKEALIIDSTFTKAYTGLAGAYYLRYQWESYFKENYLDSMMVLAKRALSFDNQLNEAYYIESIYYSANGNFDKAFDNFYRALEINPNLYLEYYHKVIALRWGAIDYVKSIGNFHKVLNLVHENVRPYLLRDLGNAYLDIGFIDKAKYYYQEALALDGDSAKYFMNMASLEFDIENFENAILFEEKISKIDSTYIPGIDCYSFAGRNQEAYKAAERRVDQLKKSGELSLYSSHRIGYAFWQVGKKEKAADYFNQQIKYCEECIKLNRESARIKSAHYDMAAIFAFIGNRKRAYQYLDEFNKMNIYQKWWICYAKCDPLFDSIRNEERFQKILQNMEARYQAEHERVRNWLEEQGMLQ